MRKESDIQAEIIKELKHILPNADVNKFDPSFKTGWPDLEIVYEGQNAYLEVKRSMNAPYRPLQEYYLNKLGQYYFARMICPENKEEVYRELQQAFGITRDARISKPK